MSKVKTTSEEVPKLTSTRKDMSSMVCLPAAGYLLVMVMLNGSA